MSAAGEILQFQGATSRILPSKMSAAGENFAVSDRYKGYSLPKLAVSRHFQTWILQPLRKFPPCSRSEHNKGGIFLEGGIFLTISVDPNVMLNPHHDI